MADGHEPTAPQPPEPAESPESPASPPPSQPPGPPETPETGEGQPADTDRLVLCPYCGHTQTNPTRCDECKGLFEPLSRKATQIAMGPWAIRDPANPFKPGCSYETLKRQIEAGRVKATSIIRGPTTRQFWSVAHNVPGVAHLVGYCHRCNARVYPTDPRCSLCAEPFSAVTGVRNELGLLYPTREAAEAAQHELDQQRQALAQGEQTGAAPAQAGAIGGTGAPAVKGDLLDQVLQQSQQGGSYSPTSPTTAAVAPAPGTPVQTSEPRALDFGPSEQASGEPAPTQAGQALPPLPQPAARKRPSLLLWLLVVLNAIAAGGVALLLLLVFGQ